MVLFWAADRQNYYRRVGVGGFGFVAADFAVFGAVKRTVLGIQIFGGHGQHVAIFLSFEADGIVAALGTDHALRERAGMDEFAKAGGIVSILLVEQFLGANNDAHVRQSLEFGVGTRGIALVLGGVAGRRVLAGRGRRRLIGGRSLLGDERCGDEARQNEGEQLHSFLRGA